MAILKIETTYNTDHYEGYDLITIPDKATHYTTENVIDYDEIKIRFRWFKKQKKENGKNIIILANGLFVILVLLGAWKD